MYKRNLTLLVCASFLAIVTLCWQNKTKVKFVDNDHLNNPEEETSSSENFTKSAAVNLNPIINERHIVNKKLFYEKEIDDPVSGLKTLRNKNLKLDVNKFSTLSVGDKIKLEFFKDTQYEAIVTSTSTDVNGTKGLVLEVEGYDKAYTYISISDNKILLNTHLPEDLNYGIRYLENESQHYAIEFKVNQADNVSCGADIDDGIPQEFENAPIVQSAGVSTLIDIMVLYTPNAKSWADANEGGINNTVNQAFIRANNALTVSETGVTYNLVHSGQVSYTESGSSGTDLDRLRLTSDGHMDEVHTSRAHKGADLISLFTDVEDTGGLGYLFTGSSALGFNITRVKQASWTYTMVHEFGHNMGCGHHSDQATQPGPGSFSYASGFRWSGHRSVMAYQKNGDSRTAHFSNPDVDHQGQATGNSTHDNVRCIETTKSAVANFVDSVDPFELKVYATDTKAFFSWAAPTNYGAPNDTIYITRRSDEFPSTYSLGEQVFTGTSKVFENNSLTPGSTYYYRIWFDDGEGNPVSAEDSGTDRITGNPDAGSMKILFRNSDGQIRNWIIGTNGVKKGDVLAREASLSASWITKLYGDIDNDGTMDLIFRHTDGRIMYWLLSSNGIKKAGGLVVQNALTKSWSIKASGDIDNDGTMDLIFRHTNGRIMYWLINSNGSKKAGGLVVLDALGNSWGIIN